MRGPPPGRVCTWIAIGAVTLIGALPARSADSSLRELAARGRFDDELRAAVLDDAESRARRQSAGVPAAFWDWLGEHPTLREGLLVGLADEIGTKAVSNLRRLREEHGRAVEDHPHLALAFSFAWSAPGGSTPLRHWHESQSWQVKDRKAPTMVEAFAYYLEQERRMRLDLRSTPWPALLCLAIDATPIEERLWALDRYGKMPLRTLHKLPGFVRYTGDGIDKTGKPKTLPNYLAHGGMCADQAWFAVGVLNSMGLPAWYTATAHHAWPSWWAPGKRGLELTRSNVLGNLEGNTPDPRGTDWIPWDRMRLLGAALNHSYDRWLDARIAVLAYLSAAVAERPKAVPLLGAAVKKNPFCREAWLTFADAVREGEVPMARADAQLGDMLRTASGFPVLHAEVFRRALPAGTSKSPTYSVKLLKRARTGAERSSRPDVAPEFAFLHAEMLSRTGDEDDAREILEKLVTELAGADIPRFLRALHGVLALLPRESAAQARTEFLERTAKATHYLTKEDAKAKRVNPYYLNVRREQYNDLEAAGDHVGAARVSLSIALETRRPEHWLEKKGKNGLVLTAIVAGGHAATDFAESRPGERLVGLRFTKSWWAGKDVIGSVQAIYRGARGTSSGETFGKPNGPATSFVAKEGYAVGGFVAQGQDRVRGMSLIFMRIVKGGLDPDDLYFGEWYGSREETDNLSVACDGRPVVGIHGIHGDDLNGIGLILSRAK